MAFLSSGYHRAPPSGRDWLQASRPPQAIRVGQSCDREAPSRCSAEQAGTGPPLTWSAESSATKSRSKPGQLLRLPSPPALATECPPAETERDLWPRYGSLLGTQKRKFVQLRRRIRSRRNKPETDKAGRRSVRLTRFGILNDIPVFRRHRVSDRTVVSTASCAVPVYLIPLQ